MWEGRWPPRRIATVARRSSSRGAELASRQQAQLAHLRGLCPRRRWRTRPHPSNMVPRTWPLLCPGSLRCWRRRSVEDRRLPPKITRAAVAAPGHRDCEAEREHPRERDHSCPSRRPASSVLLKPSAAYVAGEILAFVLGSGELACGRSRFQPADSMRRPLCDVGGCETLVG